MNYQDSYAETCLSYSEFSTVAMELQRTYKVQKVKREASYLNIIFFLKTKENMLIKPPRCLAGIPRIQILKQVFFFFYTKLYKNVIPHNNNPEPSFSIS